MKKRIPTRLLSVFLALVILLSSVPASSAAESVEEIPSVPDSIITESASISDTPVLDEASVPQIVGVENAHARDHVLRMRDEEADELNKLVFLNSDGSRTMYLYDHPVKYVDEYGDVQDISLDIAYTSDPHEPFRSASSGAVTGFSSDLSSGIRLTGNGTDLRLVPDAPDSTARNPQRLDSGTVSYPYDEHTSIEYSLTYTGFKEDIVVSQYTGQTEYSFTLYTNGLTLTEIDGSWYLTDADGNIQATIGDIIIFTADERNNTLGQLEAETVRANQEYNLTIVLDPEYLADPNTAYPIRIDPTIELYYEQDGAGAIIDLTVCSTGTQSGSSGSLYIGKRENYGTCRALMKFPGLNLSDVGNGEIISATLELRDLLCESAEQVIECYVFNGNEWTESSTWSSASAGSLGAQLDTVTFGYEIGVEFETKHRYSFDITRAVRSWLSSTTAKSKGIIFKATDTLESGSAYTYRTLASYNRSSYKPSLYVTFNYAGDGITSATGKNYVVEGGTLALIANGMNGTVTWTSSDTNIATVNSTGKVTGVHAGQVTITAQAEGYISESIALYVAFPDGVYCISRGPYYLSAKNSGISNFTQVQLEYPRSDAIGQLAQKWRIKYLGNGYYSVRPMHKPDMGLDVTGNDVDLLEIGAADVLSIPDYARWRIVYHHGSYAILNYDSDTDTLLGLHPLDATMTSGERVRAVTYNSADNTFGWTISSTPVSTRAMIYKDGKYNDNVRMGIMPNQTRTLKDMKIVSAFVCSEKITQKVDRWYSSNTSVATVDNVTGAVTGVSRGTTAIIAQYNLTGITYLASFTVVVSELPISGYEVEYDESLWNSYPVVELTNCYSYALNNQLNPLTNDFWTYNGYYITQQPGLLFSGSYNLGNYYEDLTIVPTAVSNDYMRFNTIKGTSYVFESIGEYDVCPPGSYKVALVMDTVYPYDYHWYRQDPDGNWSHKPGTSNITRTDNSGNMITNPKYADRGRYDTFVGFYIVYPWNQLYSARMSIFDYQNASVTQSIDIQVAKTISVNMAFEDVVEIMGGPGTLTGGGMITHRYELANGSTIEIVYAMRNDGKLHVDAVIWEESNE